MCALYMKSMEVNYHLQNIHLHTFCPFHCKIYNIIPIQKDLCTYSKKIAIYFYLCISSMYKNCDCLKELGTSYL